MSFAQFRMKLSEQMLKYNPRNNHYAGDDKFWRYMQQHKLRRSSGLLNSSVDNLVDDNVLSNDGLTLQVFMRAQGLPRFCETLDEMTKHFSNIVKMDNGCKCEVCREKTIWRCGVCNKNVCTMNKRTWNGDKCVLTYHNEEFCGLARSDYKSIHSKSVDKWTPPDDAAIAWNARRLRRFLAEIKQGERDIA